MIDRTAEILWKYLYNRNIIVYNVSSLFEILIDGFDKKILGGEIYEGENHRF